MEGLPYEKRFHFQDGTVVKDIEELREKIETISYEEFYTHVNSEKNDFANWVEHVLEMKELADELRAVSSIVETVEILNDIEVLSEKKEMDLEDIQSRIEQQLFAEPQGSEELPDLPAIDDADDADDADDDDEDSSEKPAAEDWSIPVPEPTTSDLDDEPRLPTREELNANIRSGAPVTSRNAPHIPITQMVAPPTDQHHLRYMLKQFTFGLITGLILGLIIGRVIGWF